MNLDLAAKFLNESMLLTEDVNSTATKKSKNLIRQRFNTKKFGIDLETVETDHHGRPDEHNRTWLQNLEYRFRNEIILRCGVDTHVHKDAQKFEPGLLRIAMDSCNWPRLNNDNIKLLSALNGILYMQHKTEYDMELSGQTLASLKELFVDEIPDEIARQNTLHPDDLDGGNNYAIDGQGWKGIRLNKNDYTVLSIDTYEQSHQFQRWTGLNGNSCPWCLTGSSGTYDRYANNGTRIYFTFVNNYQSIQPITGHNAYDAYGLSLMCVQVTANGDLRYCTSRYNHNATGYDNSEYGNHVSSDNIFTEEELCKVFNISSLKEMFPPYTDEELKRKGVICASIKKIYNLLNKPENANKHPYEIFNFLTSDKFSVYQSNDITLVELDINYRSSYFYVNEDKKILTDTIYKYALPFNYNYTFAKTNDDKMVIIDIKGNIISKFNIRSIYVIDGYEYLIDVMFNNSKHNIFNLKSGKYMFKKAYNKIFYNTLSFKYAKVLDDNNTTKLVNYNGKELPINIENCTNYYIRQTFNQYGFIVGEVVENNTTNFKIYIIDFNTNNIIPTNFVTTYNHAYKLGQANLDQVFFRFNSENIAEIPVLINDEERIVLIKTNGEQYSNNTWPWNKDFTIDSYTSYDNNIDNIVNSYIVAQNSNRASLIVIDKDGNKLVPGAGKSSINIYYNTCKCRIRSGGYYAYTVYNLKNTHDCLHAIEWDSISTSSNIPLFSGRYYKLGFNPAVEQVNGEYYYTNGIYDTYNCEFIIKPSTDRSNHNSIHHCILLPAEITNESNRYAYIDYLYKAESQGNILDFKTKELLFPKEATEYKWRILKRSNDYAITQNGTNYPGIILLGNLGTEIYNSTSYNLYKFESKKYLVDGGFDKLLEPFNNEGIAKILKNNTIYYVNVYGDISTRIENVEESTKYKNSKYLLQASYLLD